MPSLVPSPLRDATSTRRGLMGIGAQVFSGMKTFLDAIKLAVKTTATLPAGGVELEGSMVYDSTTKRAQVHDGTTWVPVVMAVGGGSAASLEEHILNPGAHNATAINYAGTLSSTNVGAALSELNSNKAEITDLTSTAGADIIGATPVGNLSGTTAQAQLNELAGADGASKIKATASGNLSSTTVQGQLNELDSEKVGAVALAASTGATLVGASAVAGSLFALVAGTLQAQIAAIVAWFNSTNTHTIGAVGEPAYGAGWQLAVSELGFSKNILNEVRAYGGAKANSTPGDIIFTFPVGYRPAARRWFTIEIWHPGDNSFTRNLAYVDINGEVQLVLPKVVDGHYFLDQINFKAVV